MARLATSESQRAWPWAKQRDDSDRIPFIPQAGHLHTRGDSFILIGNEDLLPGGGFVL